MLTLLTIVCTVGGYSQTWEKVSLTDLTTDDVFVIVGTISNKTYALPNTETAKQPAAVAITISTDGNQITGDVTDNLKWNIEKSEDKYTFYPNGNKKVWLYIYSSTATKVGIGSTSTNKTFKYAAISSKQYEGLLNTSTDRYICIYQNKDWRAYQNTNNNVTATKISYYKYTTSSTSSATATAIAFEGSDGTTVELTDGKTADGKEFVGYTAKEKNNIEGSITYAASGDAVATVDPTTGKVTINATKYGTTTITATFKPADPTKYSGSTTTYQIKNKKAVDLSEIVFDVKTDKTNKTGTGKDQLTKSIVKIESTSAALGGSGDYRFYAGSKTTFSLTEPTRIITRIKFVGGSTYSKFTTDKPSYDKTTGTWTGYEESVVFTNTSTSKIDKITKIIVTTAEKKAAPALSFAEKTVTKELAADIIDLQPITKPEDLDASAITYASSDNNTAEVDGGQIFMYKTGEVIITATSAATDKYAAGTASYKLIISDSRKDAALAVKANPVKVKLGDDIYDLASNITCDNGLNSETFKYTSSDNSYTIVDNLIQISKIGTTTITAKFGGNDSYKPAEISYTFEVEDPRTTDAAFKFAAESYNADLAEATDGIITFNAADVLQNPHSLNVTYTISPESANATIGETDGEALIEVSGTYTITATGAANDTYKETTATCTLNVTNGNETIITFIPQEDHGLGKDKDNNQSPDEMKKSFVTIASGNAWFNSDENAFCFYQAYQSWNNKTTISTTEGYITKIEFIGSSSKYSLKNLECDDTNFVAEDYYASWTGSAQSVTFTTTQQTHATQIIVTVEVPKAKNYTLDETKKDNVIETYENANVTLQRTLEASHWNSFCVPFALNKDQVTQYFGEGTQLRTYEGRCENNIVYFATVDNIEAGKPYIMKPGNAVVKNPTFEGVSMVATGLDENGNPQAVGDANTVQMKGIYNHVTLVQDKTNIYIGAGNKFYYPADAEACQMNGLRAYFIVPEGTDIKKLRANLDGATTSLGEIFDTEESNTPVYNLQGQCVGNSLSTLKSGIYVQNGKKVVVK